ncbi:sulfur carrier protein ThiS [Anaerococcus sp. AGMB09787]|uniref:sulfur carrier protein ThiS n=1 Tax=Anaerococcus sp. AGMB09787 TaxID=2922869 RepID=UPI001FAFE5FE|nr:sulfur carrier protein ThiS [Anaerococcus sp. AGMB09787]
MLVINGKEVPFEKEKSLYEILVENFFDPSFVAVEVNEKLVKREDFRDFLVKDQYKIEVFSFVGGG